MARIFKAPDRNAPRFRPSWKPALTKAVYKEFLKKFPEYNNLSWNDFKDIIKAFHKHMVQGIVDHRTGINLPERMGTVLMISCAPPKGGSVDVKASLESGYVVKHRNWDSHQRLMKIIYSNEDNQYMMKNKAIWYFNLNRNNRKRLSDGFREYPTKYIQVQPSEKLRGVLEREMRSDSIRNKMQKELEHDEFDMN